MALATQKIKSVAVALLSEGMSVMQVYRAIEGAVSQSTLDRWEKELRVQDSTLDILSEVQLPDCVPQGIEVHLPG
jgi:hypothetical protein